jgi:hypothetical protein
MRMLWLCHEDTVLLPVLLLAIPYHHPVGEREHTD